MGGESNHAEFNRISSYLYGLADNDPHAAIATTRNPETWRTLDELNTKIVMSAVLIDAGSRIHDPKVITEDCDILRVLCAKLPLNHTLMYNLANGLIAQADENHAALPAWYLVTSDVRREARRLFMEAAADKKAAPEMKTKSFTNLGNALHRANRWVEAYDWYLKALEIDSTNAIASTGAAKVLLRAMARGIGRKEDLQAAASVHLRQSRANEYRLRELAGAQAYASLKEILALDLDVPTRPLDGATEYERYVASNRLALTPTIVGLDVSLKRWDTLKLPSIIEPIDKGDGIPALFAMFNVLKAEYLLARRLSFDAEYSDVSDSGVYADTLDYALYGIKPAMLTSAQRMCLDILDKIAIAVTEYLELEEKRRAISFRTRWFTTSSRKDKERKWHESIQPCLQRSNWAVVALAEMALDIGDQGFLWEKKSFRDAGTHRFVVLHNCGVDPSRHSEFVDHSSSSTFRQLVIDSLRLARAAIIYFVEFIALEKRHKTGREKTVWLDVPSHHRARGEAD
jgi:hypothetical protein